MSDTELTFDLKPMKAQLARLAMDYGKSVGEMMRDQMRMWAQNLIELTYPKKRKVGTDAVERDIRNVFTDKRTSQDYQSGDGGWGAFDFKLRSGQTVRLYKTQNGGVFALAQSTVKQPIKNIDEISRIYEGLRRNKKGRPTLTTGYNTGKYGGLWDVLHQYLAKESSLKKFIALKKTHVGRLKAGWLAMLDYFAGGKGKADDWIRKASKGEGDAGGAITLAGNGEVWGVNKVPYNERLKDIMTLTTNIREKYIMEHLEKVLAAEMKKASH